ncbi:MAG: helix-turn-helix transcriptional regulator [Ruminococcus sp.]|nr:helix-turn-helix transcriptional regulator [Ruminococcus sp.]
MIKINLKKQLEAKGMTQSELAQLTGIRPSTVCDIFHDNCAFLKLENLDKICTALKCTPAELIDFSGGEQE